MKTRTYRKGTFEMLWDCPACDTEGLLGVTHRFCPNCGHPQDHERRRYPKPGERVSTTYQGHGADRVCGSCRSACSRISNNCHGCGAPLAGAKDVHVRPSIPSQRGETRAQVDADFRRRQAVRRAEQMAAHQAPKPPARIEPPRLLELPQAIEPPRAIPRLLLASPPLDEEAFRARPPLITIIGLVMAAVFLVGFVVACIAWKREAHLIVTGHRWSRTVALERFSALADSEWREDVPRDARAVDCDRRVRGHKDVADGEDCRTVEGTCIEKCKLVDHGDSSASEECTETCTDDREECTKRYKSVPVYDDWCEFEVLRWVERDSVTASGSSAQPEPSWPSPPHRACSELAVGCEKVVQKRASYELLLLEEPEGTSTCELPQATWASFAQGDLVEAQVRVMFGSVDCGSLRPSI